LGTYINVSVTVMNKDQSDPDLSAIPTIEAFEKMSDGRLEEGGNEFTFMAHDTKWRTMEEVMKMFSERYPNLLFAVYTDAVNGEGPWMTYVSDGKSYETEAIITFPAYDETKLGEI
jgi:hypothetical protein